ncbi:hypothetical protein ACJVC5_14045 [Peredibacter sp. HCB2-198]|uniref:hypothetical protein n=1 Tax=Peredibacter sp. HCB2-198 TaxID=3383025 RepID=UPI0038B4FE6B
MKFGLLLICLLAGQMSFAQTMREKKIKEEMLSRVDALIEKAEATRTLLEKEDVVGACGKVQEMFEIYPEHLKAIGSHMDLFNSKNVTAKNQALEHLIFVHRQSLICKQGKDSEYVDLGKLDKKMKSMIKELKKHSKVIKKGDTNYENTFYYEYEF